MNKKYKAIAINPTSGGNYDNILNRDLTILNELLSEGWVIDRETVLPCSVSAPAYRGLSSVIYVLSINKD